MTTNTKIFEQFYYRLTMKHLLVPIGAVILSAMACSKPKAVLNRVKILHFQLTDSTVYQTLMNDSIVNHYALDREIQIRYNIDSETVVYGPTIYHSYRQANGDTIYYELGHYRSNTVSFFDSTIKLEEYTGSHAYPRITTVRGHLITQ